MAEGIKENGFDGNAEGESPIGVHSRKKKRSGQEVVTVKKDNLFKFCSKDTHKKVTRAVYGKRNCSFY